MLAILNASIKEGKWDVNISSQSCNGEWEERTDAGGNREKNGHAARSRHASVDQSSTLKRSAEASILKLHCLVFCSFLVGHTKDIALLWIYFPRAIFHENMLRYCYSAERIALPYLP